jgi:uncharacterized DUF497 family protein
VSFEWDPKKAATNLRKHDVTFSEALGVFSDDYAITINDNESDPDEQRFVTPGRGVKGRLWPSFTVMSVRIVSARTAARTEREQYEAQQ